MARTTTKEFAKNAVESTKYTAQQLVTDRIPFITGTISSVGETAKDIRDWTRRNNPFRPTNGNKDPIIRQIAATAKNMARGAKTDILRGDLRFSKMQKSFNDFVGASEDMYGLDDMDFGLDDTDFNFGDFGGGDSEEEDSANNNAAAMASFGANLSHEISSKQLIGTSATINAIGVASKNGINAQMSITNGAVNKLISSNMINMSRISGQLGGVDNNLTTINKNISLLVQQGNDSSAFFNQAQQYMEHTEQTLNDIKSLLSNMSTRGAKKEYEAPELPDFLNGRFDLKKYTKYAIGDSLVGQYVSGTVGTAMKTLKMELPSWMEDMFAQNLGDLNLVNEAINKLVPAIGRISNLDKVFQSSVESFFAKMDNAEYGGLLNTAGMFGFGAKRNHASSFFSSGYEKGSVQWNGKSERALQEVIPGHLSMMESYLKRIVENTTPAGRDSKISREGERVYNYDVGKFETLGDVRKRAAKAMNDSANYGFGDVYDKFEKLLTNSNDQTRKDINNLMKKVMSDQERESDASWYTDIYNILSQYGDGKINKNKAVDIFNTIVENKRDVSHELNTHRRNASTRDNAFYLIGDDLNKRTPEYNYQGKNDREAARLAEMTAAERQQYEREHALEERRKTFITDHFGEWGKQFQDIIDGKGKINKKIDNGTDFVGSTIVKFVHGLAQYADGTSNVEGNQVAVIHDKEAVLTAEQNASLKQFLGSLTSFGVESADKYASNKHRNSRARRAARNWNKYVRRNGIQYINSVDLTSSPVPPYGFRVEPPEYDAKSAKKMHKKRKRATPDTTMAKTLKIIRNKDIDKAKTDSESIVEAIHEITDNTSISAAWAVQESEDHDESNAHDQTDKAKNAIFGDKDENGFYRGRYLSGVANMGVDMKNMFRHIMTGDGYTTSEGVKIDADSKGGLYDSFNSKMSSIFDSGMQFIAGDKYKDSDKYKKFKGKYDLLRHGFSAAMSDEEDPDSYITGRMDANGKVRKGGKKKNIRVRISSKEEDRPKTPEEVQEDAINTYYSALMGSSDSDMAYNNMSEAAAETSKMSARQMHEKLKGSMKGGIIGASIGLGAKVIGATGILPSLLLPGGPIGGAILGVAGSLLARNDKVMDALLGPIDTDGKRTGGIISKNLQDKFKDISSKILGPAALGGVAGLIFPKAVSGILGKVGTGLVGGGVFGGAALAAGAYILSKTKAMQTLMYGEDGEGGLKKGLKDARTKFSAFYQKNKKGIGRLGIGTAVGGLAGGALLGFGPAMLIPAIAGAGIGIASATSRFNDLLFGTRKEVTDANGNKHMERDGDGLIGKIGRMISVNIATPVRSFLSNSGKRMAEWIKHDIGFQVKSILEPITYPIKEAFNDLGESIRKAAKNVSKFFGKLFSPLGKLVKSIAGLGTKMLKGTLNTTFGIAGQLISAPFKLLGAGARKLTGRWDTEIQGHNKKFWEGSRDENGKRKGGFLGSALNPFAAIKDGASAFKNQKGNVFDKIGAFGSGANIFNRYGAARQKYAEENGLTDRPSFMGGLFGAENKRHKEAMKSIRYDEKTDSKLIDVSKKWANADKYNNKLDLTPKELKKRNKKLKSIFGDDYEYKNQEEMMKFIYDPLNKSGLKKEQTEAEDAKERQATIDTCNLAEEINDTLHRLFSFISGDTSDPRYKSKTGEDTRKADKDKEAADSGNTDGAEEDAETADATPKMSIKDRLKRFGANYIDIMSGARFGRWAKGKAIRTGDNIKTGIAGAALTADILRTKTINGVNDFKNGVDAFGEHVSTGTENLIAGAKNGAKKFSGGVDAFGEKFASGAGNVLAGARTLPDKLINAAGAAKDKIKGMPSLLKEKFAGSIQPGGLKADTADSRKKKDKAIKVKVDRSGEKPKKESKIGGFFSKLGLKGILATVGTVAVLGGITFLLVKFPKIMDFMKETAWPFLKDVVWPGIKGLISGIGAAVCGIGDFIRGGQNVVTSFANFCETGRWQSVDEMKAEDDASRSQGTLTNKEMLEYAKTYSGMKWMSGELTVNGKGEDVYNNDQEITIATYIYMGNMMIVTSSTNTAITSSSLMAYVDANNGAAKSAYKSISKAHKVEEDDHLTWDKAKAAYGSMAAERACQYLNGEYGDYKSVVGSATETVKAASTPSVLDSAKSSTAESVGSGSGHFMQTDPHWANNRYSRTANGKYTNMANGGCGPTSLANVATQYGISANPLSIANMAARNGYTADGGSNARLFSEGAAKLGLKSQQIGAGSIRKALSNGKKVIFAGKGNNGLYSRVGHILSARGVDRNGNAIVDDPLRSKAVKVPLSRISHGLTHAWSVGRGSESDGARNIIIDDVCGKIDDVYDTTVSPQLGDISPSAITDAIDADTLSEIESKMYAMTRADAKGYAYGSGANLIYVQKNDKWANANLNYLNGTIGEEGCVLSAIGGMLATMTGLNYRPDFIASLLSSGDAVTDVIKNALPPSFQKSGAVVNRYSLFDQKYPGATHFDFNTNDLGNYNIDYASSSFPEFNNDTTHNFFNAISHSPFVLYGGHDICADSTIFTRPTDRKKYSMHALLAVGNPDSRIAGHITPSYSIYDPGSEQMKNQARIISYSDLFNRSQGIQSVFFLNNTPYSAITDMPGYNNGNNMNAEDIKWMSDLYGSENMMKMASEAKDITFTNATATAIDNAVAAEEAANTPSDETFFEKLVRVFKGLGDIAMKGISRLFGGKSTTSMSSWVGDTTSAEALGLYNTNEAYDAAISQFASNPQFAAANAQAQGSKFTPINKFLNKKFGDVTPYDILPEWSKKFQVVSGYGNAPIGGLLDSLLVDKLVAATASLWGNAECGHNYASTLIDSNNKVSLGIAGFNDVNASEILRRMVASGELSDAQASIVQKYITGIEGHGLRKASMPGLADILMTNISQTKNAEDAYMQQLIFGFMKNPMKLYDSGVLTDPRSLVMLSQFGGFSPKYHGILTSDSSWVAKLANGKNTGDELANTANIMNTFYKTKVGSYVQGHGNRMKAVYEALGGTNTASLGFGAGITDSYDSGGFEAVDTPYAINSSAKFKIDDSLVTNRLDIIISYLKQIAINGRTNYTNPSSTAATNFDIGNGLDNDMRMRNAGLQLKDKMPIYEKETREVDKMKLIHDRIARSPRPV